MGIHGLIDAADHSLQSLAGTTLDELVSAVSNHVAYAVGQRTEDVS